MQLSITQEVLGESWLGHILPPGVYAEGLLTVPSKADSTHLLNSIEWRIYDRFRLLAYNCMGDLFIQSPDADRVRYVWLQHGYGRYIADNLRESIQLIEAEGENRNKFLEVSAFEYLHAKLGVLTYGNVYTHRPIRALGGDQKLSRCGVGQLDVYLSIVSQTFEPDGYGEFA